MSTRVEPVLDRICASARALTQHDSFQRWWKEQRSGAGDRVVVNNSFVHRGKVKTNRSSDRLALEVDSKGQLAPVPMVLSGLDLKSDLKLIHAKSADAFQTSTLVEAVGDAVGSIGELVFVLIGTVDETVRISVPLGTTDYRDLVLDPSLELMVETRGDEIVVRDTLDEEAIWNVLVQNVPEHIGGSLREKLGTALDQLEKEAYATVHLPPDSMRPDPGDVLGSVREVLAGHATAFEGAVQRSGGTPDQDSEAFNEVLRIAYNFATDAVALLKLVISICDLKPLILWMTIGEHYRLSERLAALPWQRSRKKASLENYVLSIGDARNAAFHHLFPFKRALEVRIPGEALKEISVRFLSDHRHKDGNRFDYEDKELVDLLMGFTRSAERRLPARFWQQNVEIMRDTIAVFDATRDALYALRGAGSRGGA